MNDSLKAIGSSAGTLIVNIWELVPQALGVVLIVLNIIYIIIKIKKER